MFLQEDGVLWSRLEDGASTRYHDAKMDPSIDETTMIFQAHAWKMHFLNAQRASHISGDDKASHHHNYFLGESNWKGGVPVFGGVTYSQLWPGIDLKFHGEGSNVKYDVMLSADAEVEQIGFLYEGLDALQIDDKGQLLMLTTVAQLLEMQPVAWYADNQEALPCAFTLRGNTVGFEFPEGRDKSRSVIIDPVLVGATYSGVTSNDIYGHCATYDNNGNIYSAGQAFGPGLPTSTGAFQASFGGGFGTDIAVNKFNPDGSVQLYATYIGSSEDEKPHSLIVNNSEELIVLGSSSGPGYPTTAGAFSATHNGGTDIVVSRFSPDGSALLGSTYVGGSGTDGTQNIFVNYGDNFRGEIIIDNGGNVFVASSTQSTDFPATANAFQTTLGGSQDAVVFGLTPDMTSLLWASYLGGAQDDNGLGLHFANNGELYLTGSTGSSDFPNVGNGFENNYQGGNTDGYIARFSSNGNTLLSQTFFGSTAADGLNFIDLDGNDEIYVYGQSGGTIPISPASTYGQAGASTVIAKFDASLANNLISTTLGPVTPGGSNLAPVAFLVDVCDQIYISGYELLNGWATTPNALYSTQSFEDFYLAVYDINMTGLLFGTFYGGSHVDGGTSRFDPNGIVYQGVCSGGNSMPTSTGSYAANNNVGWDVGVFKIDMEQAGVQVYAGVSPSFIGCAPATFTFNASGSANSYTWIMGDGSAPILNNTNPTHTFTNPGTYQVMLIGVDSLSCNVADTAITTVTVNPPGQLDPGFIATETSDCTDLSVALTDTTNGAGFQIQWDFGDNTTGTGSPINHIYSNAGNYTITMTVIDPTCGDTASVSSTVSVTLGSLIFDLGNDVTICNNQSATLTAPVTGTYTWSTNETTQSISVSQSGTYWVTILQNGCEGSDTVEVTYVAPPAPLGSSVNICPGDSTILNIPLSNATYNWLSTGATSQSITVGDGGAYIFQATDASGCTYQDTAFVNLGNAIVDVFVPNVFSPNTDGYNDFFKPVPIGSGTVEVEVYNRWGQLMFSSTGSGNSKYWDGKFNSKDCSDGTYFYIIRYSSQCNPGVQVKKGHLSLLR